MKKLFILCTCLLVFVFNACTANRTQKYIYHSPTEMFNIIANSKLYYQLLELKTPIEQPDYSEKLNYSYLYRKMTKQGLKLFHYETSDSVQAILDKAESFYHNSKYEEALKYYNKTIEADSTLHYVITFIGQYYEHIADYSNAKKYYLKAISKNYYDYMPHWFLADAYYAEGNIKAAVDEITIAKILNRNNNRLTASFNNIYNADARDTTNWYFNPQMKLEKVDPDTVKMFISSNWMGYAMAKSVWNYEPGFRDSMGVREGIFSTYEESDCFISLLIALENSKSDFSQDKQLVILNQAALNQALDLFALYEILLPSQPETVYLLSEEALADLVYYIKEIRHKKL